MLAENSDVMASAAETTYKVSQDQQTFFQIRAREDYLRREHEKETRRQETEVQLNQAKAQLAQQADEIAQQADEIAHLKALLAEKEK